jgi:hypothetical protein
MQTTWSHRTSALLFIVIGSLWMMAGCAVNSGSTCQDSSSGSGHNAVSNNNYPADQFLQEQRRRTRVDRAVDSALGGDLDSLAGLGQLFRALGVPESQFGTNSVKAKTGDGQ